MKIAIFETKGWQKTHLAKKLKKHSVTFFEERINDVPVSKFKGTEAIVTFINSKVRKDIIAACKNLKVIATMSTGFDHIDTAYAKSKKIPVCSVPFYGENTVAEHAMALLLTLTRNIHTSVAHSLKGDHSIKGLMGYDLKGKTIGVIGGGHIGLNTVHMARGFGMNVLVFDLYRNEFMHEVLGFEYATMDEIYKKSDIISLHVPYNTHTHHMLDKKAFNKMKKGVILINTSRGGVIDSAALKYALDKKIISKAGLDVLENEQDILFDRHEEEFKDDKERVKTFRLNQDIITRENVLFTPHTAFDTKEAISRILDTTVGNIEGVINKKPVNVVNK